MSQTVPAMASCNLSDSELRYRIVLGSALLTPSAALRAAHNTHHETHSESKGAGEKPQNCTEGQEMPRREHPVILSPQRMSLQELCKMQTRGALTCAALLRSGPAAGPAVLAKI